MWLRGPGGCGQRHGDGGRCPRPPRPGGRQECRRDGGDGRRRGCVQGAAGGRAGARRGPARSPVPGRAITCARARPAVVDPHAVNALGGRGSSRVTAESHPACPLTHDARSAGACRAGDDAWRQHGDRALAAASHSDRWTSPAACRGGPRRATSPRPAAVPLRRGSSRQHPPGRRRRRRPAGHGAARAARPRPRRERGPRRTNTERMCY